MRRLAASLLLLILAAGAGQAGTLRIATFNTELSRDGPGLLLRDIERGGDPQIAAVVEVISAAQPDVLALQGIDWDYEGRSLAALAGLLAEAGAAYPYRVFLQPNTGLPPPALLDMDGNGRTGGPRDNQGYGRFRGQGGIALLSRLPVDRDGIREFSALLWRDLPGALLPEHPDGRPFPSSEVQKVQRLSATAHWLVPLELPGGGQLNVMTFHATPPVFDGPEDRNGRRNRDEIRLWQLLLDGRLGAVPQAPFVIAGDANLDPERGEGRKDAIRNLLGDPRLQDPQPLSPQAGTATVEWQGAGRMRVDYVLPSAGLTVTGSGVVWPDAPGAAAAIASRHRLVWADIALD
ncbi:endonuclease/exonuclease/phosphatase family protein [Leisingera sp. HS039]|uniref:endonuclease/exonuclease/phosphatase family protein n=1 Tax=unclassified Leisingera TaxID=2614906 RepID=UPI0010714872|nr:MULTISPECIES: endonuclease/exonuclease/phosphatase family protein [unclassified Leisingera]MBQ4826081.1 endonuclease/exonuclease/phosphatase family protein [Leisingera sp. HS039]QBR35097.1 endonuclease/exonuclease/phosphatase family protein [Leisingera sp. NJS201]